MLGIQTKISESQVTTLTSVIFLWPLTLSRSKGNRYMCASPLYLLPNPNGPVLLTNPTYWREIITHHPGGHEFCPGKFQSKKPG